MPLSEESDLCVCVAAASGGAFSEPDSEGLSERGRRPYVSEDCVQPGGYGEKE